MSFHSLGEIRLIMNSLAGEVHAKLITSFIIVWLDSCNAVLTLLSLIEVNDLQGVQNGAAQLVAVLASMIMSNEIKSNQRYRWYNVFYV